MNIPENSLKEAVLEWVSSREPDALSPYRIDGKPPMWIIAETADGDGIAVRPARTMEKVNQRFVEVDGVAFQSFRNGVWAGQGMKASWGYFADHLSAVLEGGGRLHLSELLMPSSETDTELQP